MGLRARQARGGSPESRDAGSPTPAQAWKYGQARAVNRNGRDAMDEATRPVCYEIRVRGRLGGTLLGAFPQLRARARGTETVLTGPLVDQAALYGVLAEIEALGLELLEVRRTRG
jgi:hypothetical protein